MNTVIKEEIKVECSYGFIYEVDIEYWPTMGVAHANDQKSGSFIDSCQLNCINEPTTDDDHLWDVYSQQLEEWKDEMKSNLKPKCEEYYNRDNDFDMIAEAMEDMKIYKQIKGIFW